MKIEIIRIEKNDNVTLGIMLVDNQPMYSTLELPDKDNAKNISCIPVGRYKIIKHISPKFGKCFYVKNVPNREHILIHAGNTTADTEGCILVGQKFGKLNNLPAIMSSKTALQKLLDSCNENEDINLVIR